MKRLWLLFSQTATVLLAAYFVVATLKPGWLGVAGGLRGGVALIEAPAAAPGSVPPGSLRLAAQTAASAVVSINTSKTARPGPHSSEPWFRFFFGDQGTQPQAGLGSGVIVSPSGLILTNNHVVEGADEIEVILNDSRRAVAKIIGTDPDTDLAVLKIELDRLPVMRLGDVRALRVGDAVLAIGNPFNVGQTVTAGIVSALDRTGAGSQFQNFIQTDAAINPGNSGGALVDAAGALVGINTAIFSRSGGSMGIGFAVPVDTARSVMEQLIAGGEVRRGWIGVEPRELTPELAESLALELRSGVLIAGVLQNGPAAKAGLQPGDVVVKVAERPVRAASDLFAAVASLEPGKNAPVVVQRGKQQLTLTVEVGKRSRDARAR